MHFPKNLFNLRSRGLFLIFGLTTLIGLSGCESLSIISQGLFSQDTVHSASSLASDLTEPEVFAQTAELTAAIEANGESIRLATTLSDFSDTPLYEQYSYYLPLMDSQTRANFLTLYKGIMNFESTIVLPYPISSQDTEDLMTLLSDECPELMQLDTTWQQRSNLLGMVSSVSPFYCMDADDYIAKRNAIEMLLSDFHTQLAQVDDYTIELTLYRYIIENCIYQLDGEDVQNAYGAFISGYAKCDGRAKALLWGLRSFGINSSLLTGSNHAWVAAEIDGFWYNVDPTYDDQESDVQLPISYAHFNIPASIISTDPYPLDDFFIRNGYPETIRWDSTYHVKEGLWIYAGETATDSAKAIFTEQLNAAAAAGNGTILLRFESSEDFYTVRQLYTTWIQSYLNQHRVGCNITSYNYDSMNLLFLEVTFH